MEHPLLRAIRGSGFTPLGWFGIAEDDALAPARFLILLGNAGPAMFRRFAAERDAMHDSLDDWTMLTLKALADELSADVVFPFDEPPLPFQQWARRAGAGHRSPLGLNIHATYGLWQAYRGALLFQVEFDLPTPAAGVSPCESCAGQPCLQACPVSAFRHGAYDVAACAAHLASPAGKDCMTLGCRARRACPVGQAFTYPPRQAQFFMRAFVKARRKAD